MRWAWWLGAWWLALGVGCAPAPGVRLAMGTHHLCLLREDGSVDCALWEHAYYRDEEVQVPGDVDRWTDVAAGAGVSCGLDAEGHAHCWGEDSVPWSPVNAVPLVDTFTRIFVGGPLACGLREDGTGECFGDNDWLGDPRWWWRYRLLAPWREAMCGLATDGAVHCWGDGALTEVEEPEGVFVDLDANEHHACAVREDTRVVCWGEDPWGEVSGVPERAGFVGVTTGRWHSCGVTADGAVLCWGRDTWGQASVPSRRGFVQVGAGESSTCALDEAGEVTCWGCNITDHWPHQCEGL